MRISDWSSDVCSSDLRQERLLYTRPYYQVPQAIVVREQHAGVATPAGLATQRVAVMARTSQVGYLRRHHPHVEIVEAQTMLDLMSAVLSGKADLLIATRSEEHTSELQSLMRTSYAVFCLKKKKKK